MGNAEPMQMKRHCSLDGTEKPIDLVHLARQTMGDRELEAEILGLFLSQSADYLREFQSAQTWDEKKRVAHRIKGSARGLGAWELGDAAELAESNSDLAETVLEDSIARVVSYIRELQG